MRSLKPTEHAIQAAFVQLCRLHETRYPALQLAYGIPNAGAGASRGQAGKMKAEGCLPGIPDWHLPVSNGRHIGLYIEFKRNKSAKLPTHQKSIHSHLRLAGHRVEVCTDVEQAWAIVKQYLAGVEPSTLPLASST